MITFPNAKINLGLSITAQRPDGYHDLETVFYPVPLEDALEVVPIADNKKTYKLHCYGNEVEGDEENNLVVRAYKLLKNDFRNLPTIDISLYKHIPSGAGLGGGSSDAAFMLKLLNEQFELNLSNTELEQYASRLGADCAFFIQNRPTYATGIGNIFTPLNLSLKGYRIVIVKPNLFVSTREAFAKVSPHTSDCSLQEIIKCPIKEWRKNMTNDFEKSVFPQHPELADIKQKLYNQGALYAAMTGSGSSLFGIFPKEVPSVSSLFQGMFCYSTSLL
jgi:4-diphosphocytidyl-2-C-methyl-D-erythritol kinase